MTIINSAGRVTTTTKTTSASGQVSVTTTSNTYSISDSGTTGVTKVRSNTPNYRYRVEHKILLPCNSYTVYDGGGTLGGLRLSGTSIAKSSNTERIWNFDVPHPSGFIDFPNEVSIRALLTNDEISWCKNKAKAQMLDDVNGANELLAVFFGELHKTLDMLFTTARRLILHAEHLLAGSLYHAYNARYFQKGGNGRRGGLQNLLADLKDKWLSAYYGWQPLVYDMKNSLEAYFDATSDAPRFKIRGYNKYVKHSTTVIKGSSGPFSSYGPYELTVRTTVTYKVNVGGLLKTEPYSERPAWLREFGLTPEAIPNTLWELLKFSFIIDTFVNLGDALKNLSLLTIENQVTDTFYMTERFEVCQVVESFRWTNEGSTRTQGLFHSTPRVTKFFRRSPLSFYGMHVTLQLNPEPYWLGVANAALILGTRALPRSLRI